MTFSINDKPINFTPVGFGWGRYCNPGPYKIAYVMQIDMTKIELDLIDRMREDRQD